MMEPAMVKMRPPLFSQTTYCFLDNLSEKKLKVSPRSATPCVDCHPDNGGQQGHAGSFS